jgi:glucose-6-phosphate isomerase
VKRIHYDYTNLRADVVGPDRGLTDADIDALRPGVGRAVEALAELNEDEETTFVQLGRQDPSAIVEAARGVRDTFSDLVVIGIGGSSLGTRALWSALTRRHSHAHLDGSARDGVRLHFLENTDPLDIVDLLSTLDLERTAFNVVTKSGGTIETMSTYFLVRERLIERFGEEGFRARMFATTDPAQGGLRSLVRRDGLHAFDVPPGVGGRYSALTPVGLFPLACAGIDVAAILEGADLVSRRAFERDPSENAAAMLALAQVALYRKGVHDVVFMPYAQGLVETSAWFVQLWAESLGKRGVDENGGAFTVGPTPIAALGTVDQHSQLQLFMEGPANKNIVFVEVEDMGSTVAVPPVRSACESLSHLGGRRFDEITRAELAGVREGLAESQRPTSTLRLEKVNAETMGGLLMLLECATAIVGTLFEIDPFNQPGVELAKRFAHGLLGREKERHYAERLRTGMSGRPSRFVGA